MIQSGNATLLKRFSKDCFAVDVEMSKCLHMRSSNALFCTHYVGNANHRSLITVAFPVGSIGKKRKRHVRILIFFFFFFFRFITVVSCGEIWENIGKLLRASNAEVNAPVWPKFESI